MRALAVSLVALFAGSALAQLAPAEQGIQDAFASIRASQEVMLVLDGVDRIGTRANSLYSTAFFLWDPIVATTTHKLAKTDVNDYVNNVHTHRIAGDGMTLWSYDYGKNAYTSFRYGAYAGAQSTDFRMNLLQEATASSRGPTVFLARMLREIFAGDVAQYSSWLPMASVTVVSTTSGTASLADPIVSTRSYDSNDLNYYVVYTYASRPRRSAAFHFVRTDLAAPWTLQEIYYADSLQLNASTPRLVDWRISVYTGILPASTNYVFVPPASARAISNVRGQGG